MCLVTYWVWGMGRKCEGNKKENLGKAEKFNTTKLVSCGFSTVQFSCSVVSNSLWPHGLQHTRPPCPSPTPKSLESVMPSNYVILCHPLLFPPSIFPSVRVFSNESALGIRWPKFWSFSFSISLSNDIQDLFPLGWTGWMSLHSKGDSQEYSPTPPFKSINSSVLRNLILLGKVN